MSVINRLQAKTTFVNVLTQWNQKSCFHAAAFQFGHYLSLFGSAVEPANGSIEKYSRWTKEDSEKLKELVDKHGESWTMFNKYYFPSRSPQNLRRRYLVMFGRTRWTSEEKLLLKQHLQGVTDFNQVDWASLQEKLPNKELSQIKEVCKNFEAYETVGRYTRWKKEDVEQLLELAESHQRDWELIAAKLNRTKRQCRNKWLYEMSCSGKRAGEFTEEEDKALTNAVELVGEHNFRRAKEVMGTKRTAAQLTLRYWTALHPQLNRGPWEEGEVERLFEVYKECKSISEVIRRTKSRRPYLWINNKFRALLKTHKE